MKNFYFALLTLVLLNTLAKAQVNKHNKIDLNSIPREKIYAACRFFGGDTLDGFPLEETVEQTMASLDIAREIRTVVRYKEIDFVKAKYKIKKLPFEIKAEQNAKSQPPAPLVSACNNVDFENGNFGSWTGRIGYNPNSAAPLVITATGINTLGMNSAETSCSFHTLLTSAAGTDPYGGFSVIDPGGGTYSVRLGGEDINWNPLGAACSGNINDPVGGTSNGETLEQTFLVTPSNALFSYSYAVILENAPHSTGQQPYFSVEVFDQSGTTIPCLNYYVEGNAGGTYPTGFTVGAAAAYLPWRSSSLNLLPYMGQNIKIRFTAAGCYAGGHFGYAYIDCQCSPLELIVPSSPVCTGNNETITAPANGGGTYSWSGPGIVSGGTSQVVTANQPGTYSVTITNAAGCFYVLDTNLVFYPTPTVTVNSPTTCPNTPVNLTAGGANTYAWAAATGLNTTTGSVVTATNPSSTSYTVTGTSVNGCTNTAVANITIGAPVPTFNAPPVCIGATSVVNNTSGGTGDWNFGDGSAIVTNQTSPSHTYASAGQYVVTATLTLGGGCSGVGTNTFVVNVPPTVTATGNAICNGAGPVNITGGGATTYTWDNGSTTNPQSVNPATSTNYTVTGTDANGCVNTATCNVAVISNPTVTVANTSICPGSTGTLTANSNGTTFSWTGPNITSATTGSVITANPAATSTYSVIASAGTCTVSTTAQITINPSIIPTFSATTVCAGQPTLFTNTTPGVATYTWTYGDSSPSNTTIPNPSNTYSAAGSYVATFSVINAAGCSGMSSNTITVNGGPTPAFTSSTPCMGTAVTFNNTTPAVPAIATWAWAFGDGNNSAGQSPTNSYSAAAVYSAVLTATTTSGCVGSFTAPVIVHPNPVSSFSNTTVCLNTPPTGFTDQSTLVNPAGITDNITNWAWTFGDGNTSAAPSPTNSYATCGTFTASLLVTTNNLCTSTSSAVVTVNCVPVLTPPASPTVCPNSLQTPGAFVIDIPGSTATWTAATTVTGVSTGGTGTVPPYTTTSNVTGATISDVIAAVPTSPAGCIGLPQTFTVSVFASPVPVFTSSTPCMGTAVTFNNTTPAAPAIATWAWTFGDGNISAAQSPTNSYSAAAVYTTVLSATTTPGCVGSFSAQVFVHPNPVSTFSNTTVCLNTGPTGFTDQSTLVNPTGITDNITNWSWTFGDGNTSATQSPTNNSYATCGTFTASLLVTTNNFCTSTSSVVVTVNCVPVLTPPASPTVCPNSAVTPGAFTIDLPGSIPTWTAVTTVTGVSPASGSGTVPPYTSMSPNLTGGNISDVITAVPTSTAGCIGSAKTFTITVYPTPIMNTMPDITVCDFQTVNVAAFGSFPAGSTFAWNNSNTIIGLAASGAGNIASFPGQTGGSPTSVVASVSVTPTLNGCVGPDSTFVITISPQPTLALTSPPLTCPGSTVPAPTYTTSPNDPSITFSWANSNINTGMPATGGPTIEGPFTAAGNTTLANIVGVVTVTPTLGTCVGLPATYTVTIYPTPTITPSIVNVEYCPNVQTNSIAIGMIPNSGGVQVYSWIDPGGAAIGLTTTASTVNIVPSFTTINTGITDVSSQVIVNASLDGCLAVPVTFTITVNPNPIAVFNASSKVCLGAPMSFTDASIIGSGTVTQWGWDFNNDGIYTDALSQNPAFTFPAPAGTHTVGLQITSNKGCKDDTAKTVYINYIPVPQFAGDVLTGCPIHPVNYTENSTVAGPAQINSWSWNFGNGTVFNTQTAGNFPATVFYNNTSAVLNAYYMVNLTVTTDSGCTASLTNTNYITVYPHPIAAFGWGPQEADVENPVIYFVDESVGASGGGVSNIYGPNGMMWNLGDVFLMNPANNYIKNVQNPVHTYEHYDPYTYDVWQWVENSHGCRDSIHHPVEIKPTWSFYIPNAFSPNGDGTNDGFKGTGVGIDNSTYNLWVFDRWGMQIFYTNDMERTWDGHIQGHPNGNIVQEDVYVWKVKFSDFKGGKHEYKGTVSVVK